MEAHKYKLIYFDGRGRAEAARWLFALADVPYEDVRYTQEEWKNGIKEKLDTPFGQLPVLEIDDGKEVISQSLSIQKYLAEEFGFAGKTPIEKAKADMVVQCVQDFAYAVWVNFFEEDKERKEKAEKKVKEEELPKFFKHFEAMLKKNNGGDGFFVGDSVTWADVAFAHQVEYVSIVGLDADTFLADYPKLKALKDRVLQLPEIAAWVAKRPESKF